MILENSIEFIVNNQDIKKVRENGFPDVKRFDKILLPINLLGTTSKKKIKIKCDYCGEVFLKEYCNLLIGRKTINKDSCMKCKHLKAQETNYINYGFKSTFETSEQKEKTKKIILKRYKTTNVMKVEWVRNKQQATMEKRFGVKSPIHNEEIRRRITKSKRVNGAKVSKLQFYLAKELNGFLNVVHKKHRIDILIDNIAIEYNGSGHRMSISFKQRTIEEFETKELKIENNILLDFNLLVVENPKDRPLTLNKINEIKEILLSYDQEKGEKKIYCV